MLSPLPRLAAVALVGVGVANAAYSIATVGTLIYPRIAENGI